MPDQKNLIDVALWLPPKDNVEPTRLAFPNLNYLSFVNDETYGIPPLIAERRIKEEGLPMQILYVNPDNLAAMRAVRKQ